MRLSDDQVSHLTQLIVRALTTDNHVKLKQTTAELHQAIAREFRSEFQQEAAIETEVRQKLASYSRGIIEGSPEWDVMYKKLYDEARRRHGLR